MAGTISWKEFEAIIARLQKNFAGNGKVTRDDKIPGRNSGKKRQIDISIRVTIGSEALLIIVECKKWNRKVDVKAVEAFVGAKEDVGAHAGIMISTKGFTQAARNTAATKGISLYRYEDTLKEGWPSGVETNVLLEVWELTPTIARLILDDGTETDINDDNDFIDTKTGEVMGLATIIRKLWDGLEAQEKYERSWASEYDCTTPEFPSIRRLRIGATSKKVRGYKKGRLQFEGLIDESKGHAKVDRWKMVFGGEFSPISPDALPPNSETLSIMMSTTHVRTQDKKTEGLMKLVYDGILELTVQNKSVIELPIRRSSGSLHPIKLHK